MKKLTVLLLSLLVVSCTYTPVTIKELLPVGSTLRLTQPLKIPPDRSYVFIQHGKIAPFKNFNSVDIYKPYCEFHLRKKSDQARRIEPDTFKVTKIVEWEGYTEAPNLIKVASADSVLAAGGINIRIGSGDYNDSGPSIIMYATILTLQSDRQPEVKEMVCGHWYDQGKVEALTLEQFKTAIGNMFLIEGTDSR